MAPQPQPVGPDPVVGEILTNAFTDDPFMAWIFGNVPDVAAALAPWWAFLVENGPEGGEVWRMDDGGAGAIWHPPRHTSEASDDAVADTALAAGDGAVGADKEGEGGAVEGPFVTMLGELIGDRVEEVLAFFGVGREMHPPEPHWYLLALGTRTDRQGQGLGAQLVRPMLDRCDAQGLGAYLESSNPRNIPFYHRLGFAEVGETWTPDDQALITGMWRSPR
jgi:ribosomal protein S18 acetylase RimI-like enzyme